MFHSRVFFSLFDLFDSEKVLAEGFYRIMAALESLDLRDVTHFPRAASIIAIADVLVCIDNLVHFFLRFLIIE